MVGCAGPVRGGIIPSSLRGIGEGVVGMTSSMVRWGGLAGAAAALMFLLSGILTLIAPPQGARVPSAATCSGWSWSWL